MFGRRRGEREEPAVVAAPLRVTVVTPGWLVRGTVSPAITFVTIPTAGDSAGSWSPLELDDAELAPPGDDGSARRLGAYHAHGDGIVALLVHGDPAAPALRGWARHEDPVPGEFHLGAVVVRGTMRRLNPGVMGHVMPVSDARVEWPAEPGAGALSAPLALVNTRWLSGWLPTGTPPSA